MTVTTFEAHLRLALADSQAQATPSWQHYRHRQVYHTLPRHWCPLAPQCSLQDSSVLPDSRHSSTASDTAPSRGYISRQSSRARTARGGLSLAAIEEVEATGEHFPPYKLPVRDTGSMAAAAAAPSPRSAASAAASAAGGSAGSTASAPSRESRVAKARGRPQQLEG